MTQQTKALLVVVVLCVAVPILIAQLPKESVLYRPPAPLSESRVDSDAAGSVLLRIAVFDDTEHTPTLARTGVWVRGAGS